MNFEEMQSRWQTQFPPTGGTPPDAMNAKLLERILRNQRGYTRTLLLMAARDVLALGLIVATLIFIAEIGPHPTPAFIRGCGRALGIWTAVIFVLQGVILRRMPGMLAIRAERSPQTLDSRVHRDARRFRLLGIWGEVKQVVFSALMVAFVVLLTERTGLRGPLRWIAVGLVAVPAVTTLARRFFVRPKRTPPEQSVSDTLALAIQQTEAHLRQMQRGWYPPLPFVGIVLSLKPVWWNEGAIRPIGWVLLAIFTALWIFGVLVNRWAIRRLLRPRLAELKQLQAGLTSVNPPSEMPKR